MTIKIWTDRSGKRIDAKEFLERWKEGMKGITPLQQMKSMQTGYGIMIAGSIFGIVVSAINKLWWLVVILLGNLLINGTSALGNWQKIKQLTMLEKQMKSFEIDEKIQGNYIQ
jgi:hypothetical protein